MGTSTRLRVATYNIHKCRGFDRKTSPDRIADVLHELDADILCLQEVVHAPGGPRIYDQANEIARTFPGYNWAFGANRPLRGGVYGNMTLTRLALESSRNHDLTHRREERGVLETGIAASTCGRLLHVFNLHLGTGFRERRDQATELLSDRILTQPCLHGPRLVLGDFNEWTEGLTTRLLRLNFQTFQPTHGPRYPRTFPGMLPLLTLDHLYYEAPLDLLESQIWRTPKALIASDHLPLIADFHLP